MYIPAGKTHVRSTEHACKVVAGLHPLFAPHENLDALLQAAASIIAESLALQRCVITWLAEDRVTLWVRAKYRRTASPYSAQNGALQNDEREDDQALLETVFEPHAAQSKDGRALQKMTAPLRVNGRVLGYVSVAPGKRVPHFDADLFSALCEIVSRAVEHVLMRQMLASRYATVAAGKAVAGENLGPQTFDACVLQTAQNPEKIARIIARSFYKDLRKAGFAAKQILLIASEIIRHLNEAFHKTKAKTL